MKINYWSGGLQKQEVQAIKKIESAFSAKARSNSKRGQSREDTSLYPWKGYAGFRLAESKGREGEFDLVIITHCNVIIVELKDWNGKNITSSRGRWFFGDEDRGKSPVEVTRRKKELLERKLNSFKHRFTNRGFLPHVHFFVVMTGNANFSQLSETDKNHTYGLKSFMALSDQTKFEQLFKPHPNSLVLHKDIEIFDELFDERSTQPKPISVGGYVAEEQTFVHPKKLYTEYFANSETARDPAALLRVWDFDELDNAQTYTSAGRTRIVSREREVLSIVKRYKPELYNRCLRSITAFQESDVTAQYAELYELPYQHERFNKFIAKFADQIGLDGRLNLMKLLVGHFSELHDADIAHRDIGSHSVWFSPSSHISLSSFATAYHPAEETVGDIRSSVAVGAFEESELLGNSDRVTPFVKDTHALGLICWNLIEGRRLSPANLEKTEESLLSCDEWFAEPILTAVSGGFNNAGEFLTAIKRAEPKPEELPVFSDSDLVPYRRNINLIRQYETDNLIKETDEKEIYISSGRLVKSWLTVDGKSSLIKEKFRILEFCKHVERLMTLSIACLPRIHDFGIASRSSCLYLVTDYVEGKHWGECIYEEDEKICLVSSLIHAVMSLHELGVSHGDLHPKNILIQECDNKVILIDVPDFSSGGLENKNHFYSPSHIDASTSSERDCFAVLRMIAELLEIEWGQSCSKYPIIAEAIKIELDDLETGFFSLDRFNTSFSGIKDNDELGRLKISIGGKSSESVTLLHDNGELFVSVEPGDKVGFVQLELAGFGGILTLNYDSLKDQFIGRPALKRLDFIPNKIRKSSQLRMDCSIDVCFTNVDDDISSLVETMRALDGFESAVLNVVSVQKRSSESDIPEEVGGNTNNLENPANQVISGSKRSVLSLSKGTDKATSGGGSQSKVSKKPEFTTEKLWGAILDTETESHPSIVVSGDPESSKANFGVWNVPYDALIDPLDGFEEDDTVYLLRLNANGTEANISEVDVRRSSRKDLTLVHAKPAIQGVRPGDQLYLRSQKDITSFLRRRNALDRLLNKQSVIPELASLFEPEAQRRNTSTGEIVTEEMFARYDRTSTDGRKITLNSQQRHAFSKLIGNGPLSLLQGPPGTGKTEFIAAFVHYLIEQKEAKRILLVSQSHEAVNNAADRIRMHCKRLGNDLEVVRFSNSEHKVSSGLQDVYSGAITAKRRELFSVEYPWRAAELHDALGLDKDFLSELMRAQLTIFNLMEQAQILSEEMNSAASEDDKDENIAELRTVYKELVSDIRGEVKEHYQLELPDSLNFQDSRNYILDGLCRKHDVQPDEARKAIALAKMSADMLDVMGAKRTNSDEFYARSRQLVVGTCVGIGQGHINIKDNIYDWVIVDEAARSIASELAIALQVGKRVLLVGDHKQLPPLYTEAHQEAVCRKLGITGTKDELEEILQSDFERAFNSPYGSQVSASLLTQYRMAPPIGNLVSATFYDSKLANGEMDQPEIYSNMPDPLTSVVSWLDTSSHGKEAQHERGGRNSLYNRFEANQIIMVLKQLSQNGPLIENLIKITNSDEPAIGIISMYSAQRELIRKLFTQELWDEQFRQLVKIDSVDSYQGKENRIVILSLTRSGKNSSPGFLRNPNRINVAMSRAMDRLLIVGDAEMWRDKHKNLPLGRVIQFMEAQTDSEEYRFSYSIKDMENRNV